jgi:prepilin-type processing-associated H-X9-DG protein
MFTKSPTNTDPYVNEYGRERPRWQWFFDYGIGPVIDPSPYVSDSGDTFGDSDTLIMTNDYFMCPSFNRPGFEARDIRNGSYGYNYHYLGNSRISDGKYRNFPVKRSVITRISETVLVADSRGILPEGIHGYTLDPPKLPRSVGGETFARWLKPTLQGQHSPADARHNGNVNVVFLDSHVEKMTLEDLGYVRDNKEVVIADHPDGSNCFWSGGQGRE